MAGFNISLSLNERQSSTDKKHNKSLRLVLFMHTHKTMQFYLSVNVFSMEMLIGDSSLLCWKLTPLVSSPVFPCLPLINMCKGGVNDVTHCFILETKVPSCILIKCLPPYIMKWIGLLMSVTLLQ